MHPPIKLSLLEKDLQVEYRVGHNRYGRQRVVYILIKCYLKARLKYQLVTIWSVIVGLEEQGA